MRLNDSTLLANKAYIDGQWSDARSGETFDVVNPASGGLVATVPNLGVDETVVAVEAAEQARHQWASRTAKDRGVVLRAWADLLKENAEDLAAIMTSEMGKPVRESRGEVAYAASFIDWYAEEAKRAYGDVIPSHDPSKRLLTLRQPVGVVGAITPWNFPLAMITRKLGPALAAGCATVVKPSELSPLSALAAAVLAERAGLPAGLMNIVPTVRPAEVGGVLTSHPLVRKISFTGSTAVGKKLMEQSASTVKRVSMELGGNAPFVVFDDADLDAAVEGLIQSKYRNAGQTCVCANRVFVHDAVYDDFAKRLAVAVGDLGVGPGMADDTDIGPLVSDAALAKVEELVSDACEQGATALTGGRRHQLGRTFYEVTVLTDVTPDMRIASEEIFGPVAPLFRFATEAEAIQLANDTPFGLASYFYASDLGRIWRVAEGLEYGLVGVNTGLMSTEVAPFGGYKESGVGREGSHEGLDEYMETKYIAMQV